MKQKCERVSKEHSNYQNMFFFSYMSVIYTVKKPQKNHIQYNIGKREMIYVW